MALEFFEEKDGKKALKQDLFTSIAETKAKSLAINYYESKEKRNNPTQIRRFFDEIVTFTNRCEMLMKNTDADKKALVFQQQLPLIKMLIPKVRYAWARELVSEDFVSLMLDSTNNLKEPEDTKVFSSFFEAIIGHFKYYITVLKEEYKNKNYSNSSARGGSFTNVRNDKIGNNRGR